MLNHKEGIINGYFLCYYIPDGKDITEISGLLKAFKANEMDELVDHWCEWASHELSKEKIRITHIVRALKNTEVKADSYTSLDRLGSKLAENLNAFYVPEILRKRVITPPLKKIIFRKRKPAIENTYYINSDGFSSEDTILIIDDIYSSGATINEIIRALKEKNSSIRIYFFTLGKTSFDICKNEYLSFPYFIYKTLF